MSQIKTCFDYVEHKIDSVWLQRVLEVLRGIQMELVRLMGLKIGSVRPKIRTQKRPYSDSEVLRRTQMIDGISKAQWDSRLTQ